MPPILAATGNVHKLRELAAILAPLGIEVLAPVDVGGIPEIEEDGETFVDNAIKKARGVAAATGYCVFADDSGLEVTALGGEPGVRSARYAPTDAERIARVLGGLATAADRAARFVCAIAVAAPDRLVGTVQGDCPGHIAAAPRGASGFGYDPIFVPAGHTRTFAEMSAAEKDAISHRHAALHHAVEAGLFAALS